MTMDFLCELNVNLGTKGDASEGIGISNQLNKLTVLRDRFQHWWSPLDNAKQLYVAGMVLLGLSVGVGTAIDYGISASVLFMTAAVSTGIAFVIEGYRWLLAALEAPLAKWMTGVAGVMAAAIATGAASSTLAAATGQDPSTFKTAIAFLAPLSFVPILAMMVMLGGLIGMPFFVLGMFAKHGMTRGKPKDFDMLLSLARLIGFIVIVSAAAQLVSPSTRLNDGLETVARYSAYLLDMYPDRACSPIEGDRVSRINDNLIIIGRMTDDGLQFVRKECAISAESTDLRPSKKPTAPTTDTRQTSVVP